MTLRDELTQIPGVVDADIDLRDGRPIAIRIQSDESVDQRMIGEAVQYALRRHGLRSRVAPPRSETEPERAPEPPHLSLTSMRDASEPRDRTPARPAGPAPSRVAAVSIRDDGRRCVVEVTDSSGVARREIAKRSSASQIAAIIRATARVHGSDGALPTLVALDEWEREGDKFVTVILELDGDRRVGSAVADGLVVRAIAQAAWQALSG